MPPDTNESGNIPMNGTWRRAATTTELGAVLTEAVAQGRRVRPVGRRYSTSRVLEPHGAGAAPAGPLPGWLVDLSGMVLDPHPGGRGPNAMVRMLDAPGTPRDWYLIDPGERRKFVEVSAGARVDDVNAFLDGLAAPRGLAMMGAFSNQTLLGAAMTSTHGSGARFGVLADLVRSLDLVTVVGDPSAPHGARVARFRIEPTQGFTNPGAYRRDTGCEVVARDALFEMARVSMGYAGVAVSAILETRAGFDLELHREITTWPALRALFLDKDPRGFPRTFAGHYGCGVTMSPYPLAAGRAALAGHDAVCAVSRIDAPAVAHALPVHPPGATPCQVMGLLTAPLVVETDPSRWPAVIDGVIRVAQPAGTFRDRSDRVLASAAGFPVRGVGTEWAFRIDATNGHVRALDAMFARLDELARPSGGARAQWLAGLVTIRFVRSTTAWLGLSYSDPFDDAPYCIVEVLSLEAGDGARILPSLEAVALANGGRPHWGQLFGSTASLSELDEHRVKTALSHWPSLRSWQDEVERLGVGDTFENRVGRILRTRM